MGTKDATRDAHLVIEARFHHENERLPDEVLPFDIVVCASALEGDVTQGGRLWDEPEPWDVAVLTHKQSEDLVRLAQVGAWRTHAN